MLWPSCLHSTYLPTLCWELPLETACPEWCLLPSIPALGRAQRRLLRPNPSHPCLAGSHPLPSSSGLSPPLPNGSGCFQHHCAASSCLPSPAAFYPQPSPAGCHWMRGTASTTPCDGTTTKESPSAGPSSTVAARATSTALRARRSVSCTVGSAQGQVGRAWHSYRHWQVQQHLHPVPWAQQCRAGGTVLVPRLSSDSAWLLSTDSRGSAGSKVGGQPKV